MFGKDNKQDTSNLSAFNADAKDSGQVSPYEEGGNSADLSGLDVVVADALPEEGKSVEVDTFDWDDEDFSSPVPQPDAPQDEWDLEDEDFGFDDEERTVAPVAAAAAQTAPKGSGKHAAHAAKPTSKRGQKKAEKKKRLEEMPDHQRRSLRTRRVLIVVLVLLLALAAAGVYLFSEFLKTSAEEMGQMPDTTDTSSVEAVSEDAQNTADSSVTVQKTQIPNLTGLFGLTQDEAIEAVGHGATVSTTTDENEEGSVIKKRVSLELSEEPGDTKSGTPTVYLGLDEDDTVVMAGYSAATASLGYGTLSLKDIVENEHVIEHALNDAGLRVEEGSVALPEDPSEYQTYDSDGSTLVKESVSFEGEAKDANDEDFTWTGVLAYDYTAANASGNLADTVRQVYVYIEQG